MPRQSHAARPKGHPASPRRPRTLALAVLVAAQVWAVACAPVGDGDTGDGAMGVAHGQRQGVGVGPGGEGALTSGVMPKRTRAIAAMMFDISGGPPDRTAIHELLVGTGASLRHLYNQVSYGLADVNVDVLGPYALPVPNCLTIACCGPSSDRTGNGPTVAALIDGLPRRYDHYFWVYGGIPSGANCGTWGDQGTASQPAVYSSYGYHELIGYAQELGHNFGMIHEATMSCPGLSVLLDDPSRCTHVEYGSLISFMGQGSSAAYHPSAYHKFQQGWISRCNAVRVGGAGGRYRLVPQELPCDGVQLLQIPAPKSRPAPAGGRGGALDTYYLEMRATYGFDKVRPQVLVSVGGELPTTTALAPYLYLLDLTPESGMRDHTNAGLMTVGQSFVDPAGGLTITLAEIDETSATVVVQGGGAGTDTCSDGAPFVAPGPDGSRCGPVTGLLDGGVPPPDGTGGASGSGGGAGGSDGGMGGDGPVDGGCSCRMVPSPVDGTVSLLAALSLTWAPMFFGRRRSSRHAR